MKLLDPWEDSRGHTLLELILAMLILAVLVGTITPQLNRTVATVQLRASARRLASDMRLLQQKAITDSSASYFIFFRPDGTGNNYDLVYSFTNRRKVKLDRGVKLVSVTFPNNRLLFRATGTVETGGHAHFQDNYHRNLYVIIDFHTGRVRISDQPPA
ncbi:MAG: prepilin-type N-terminal cleavage/methylation domain-containing protein [Bacillota bacterium]